jgi:DNA-directed RNA polymerase subunit RPC12/RpoP
MASLNPNAALVSCPGCGAQYDFPASMAGKRGRCAKCGQAFTVPHAPPSAERLEDLPQYIGINCHLCDTRMYGGPDQIGKELKCPDCGARTVLTRPQPKKKNIPAALQGEQYELLEPDVSRPGAPLVHQPKYIAVTCRKCDTLMYATEKQVGESIACPDCGRKQVVPARVKPKPKPSPMTSDVETPMLDPTSAPTARPSALSPEARRKLYEEERDSEYGRALEKSRRTGKPMEIDVRGRPILPRWPLLTGVWRMILTEEVISRWILSSIVLGFAGQFLGEALLTPLQGMAEAIKLIFTVVGGMLAVLWLAMVAPFIVAIIGETADGHNKLHQPPRLVALDWFNELFSVVFAGSVAGLCGFGVSQLLRLTPLAPTIAAAIVAAVVVLVLPFVLLSTLLEGSPFGVVSPRLFRSLGRCAGAWLLFYVQTFALAALAGGAAWMLALAIQPARDRVTVLLWCLAPLGIAALFIDMRMLGRLAWLIVERMPEGDETEA